VPGDFEASRENPRSATVRFGAAGVGAQEAVDRWLERVERISRSIGVRLPATYDELAGRVEAANEKPANCDNHVTWDGIDAALARHGDFQAVRGDPGTTVSQERQHLTGDVTSVSLARSRARREPSDPMSTQLPDATETDPWRGSPHATRLERRRRAAGLSQQELGGRAHVDPRTISRIEHRQHVPMAATMIRLARVLGCRMEELYEADWLE
jgi:DNA-binding XRE family transcriptional regulator